MKPAWLDKKNYNRVYDDHGGDVKNNNSRTAGIGNVLIHPYQISDNAGSAISNAGSIISRAASNVVSSAKRSITPPRSRRYQSRDNNDKEYDEEVREHNNMELDDDKEIKKWTLPSLNTSSTAAAVETFILKPINKTITSLSATSQETNSDDDDDVPPEVDIRPRLDREEVEIIARSFSAEDESMTSISQLLCDPTGSEDQTYSMNLRIIRGRDFPFEHSRIRIAVLTEDGIMDQILGKTPWSKGDRNPIFGTAACSWSVRGRQSMRLLFTIEDGEDNAEKKEDDRPQKGGSSSRICAKVVARDLINTSNPNLWFKFTDYGPSKIKKCGRIQIRLTRPTEASLHQQENCRRITPGPAFPRMESYAIRKKAMYGCSPVILNVYDVSNDGRVESINNTVKTMGLGGIFHAAIQIHGTCVRYIMYVVMTLSEIHS